jgi:hypothetical protein
VAQGVQGPLQRDAGQLGGLARLLADVLAVYRLVAPAAGEDRLLGLAGQTSGLGVDQNRQPDRGWQRPLPLLAALAAVAAGAIRLQGIQPEAEQPLQGVQLGAGGALAGGEREVTGKVGQGQLAGGIS